MVERAHVFDAADELVRRGENPSVRRVTALLPTGGSPNVVNPFLREWLQARGDTEPEGRPDFVDRMYEDFLSRVWVTARAEAMRSFEAARAKVEAMDGRLIELETQLAERDALLDELRRERDVAAREASDERAGRAAAEQRAADLAEALAAEKEAASARERASRATLAEDAHWDAFAAGAARAIRAAGKPLTAQEIVDALKPGFRATLLDALGSDQKRKVRQWLDRRAKEGEGFVRVGSAASGRSPAYAIAEDGSRRIRAARGRPRTNGSPSTAHGA